MLQFIQRNAVQYFNMIRSLLSELVTTTAVSNNSDCLVVTFIARCELLELMLFGCSM